MPRCSQRGGARLDACIFCDYHTRQWLEAFVRTIRYRPVMLAGVWSGEERFAEASVAKQGLDRWVPIDHNRFALELVNAWLSPSPELLAYLEAHTSVSALSTTSNASIANVRHARHIAATTM